MNIHLDNQGSRHVAHFLDVKSEEWVEEHYDHYLHTPMILLPHEVEEFRNNFVDAGGAFV